MKIRRGAPLQSHPSRDREKGKRSETAHGTTLRRMRYRFSYEIPLSHPHKMTEREIGRRKPTLSRTHL